MALGFPGMFSIRLGSAIPVSACEKIEVGAVRKPAIPWVLVGPSGYLSNTGRVAFGVMSWIHSPVSRDQMGLRVVKNS